MATPVAALPVDDDAEMKKKMVAMITCWEKGGAMAEHLDHAILSTVAAVTDRGRPLRMYMPGTTVETQKRYIAIVTKLSNTHRYNDIDGKMAIIAKLFKTDDGKYLIGCLLGSASVGIDFKAEIQRMHNTLPFKMDFKEMAMHIGAMHMMQSCNELLLDGYA